MNELFVLSGNELTAALPLEQNPAALYLASLTPTGRRSQAHALGVVAHLLAGDQADLLSIPWPKLRYQHVMAIRNQLMKHYKPATATVNRTLCAVRGVLKAAWRLEQLSSEEYQRTIDVASVTGETLPTGRELSAGEISCFKPPKTTTAALKSTICEI